LHTERKTLANPEPSTQGPSGVATEVRAGIQFEIVLVKGDDFDQFAPLPVG
jgi:hypothetical protein